MTSGDMKVELNEDREIANTIPNTYPSNNSSIINPGAYDRNIGEIDFIDSDFEYEQDHVFFEDEPDEDEDYDPPKRFR